MSVAVVVPSDLSGSPVDAPADVFPRPRRLLEQPVYTDKPTAISVSGGSKNFPSAFHDFTRNTTRLLDLGISAVHISDENSSTVVWQLKCSFERRVLPAVMATIQAIQKDIDDPSSGRNGLLTRNGSGPQSYKIRLQYSSVAEVLTRGCQQQIWPQPQQQQQAGPQQQAQQQHHQRRPNESGRISPLHDGCALFWNLNV